MKYHTILKGANVLYEDKFIQNAIGIGESGIIEAVGPNINGYREISLDGKHVLPGLVDTHVHFRDLGQEHKETWETGSKAAAVGGITYVVDMPNNLEPIITPEKVVRKMEVAERDSIVNFSVYGAVTRESLPYLREMAPLVLAFKLFMGESTGGLNYPYDEIPEAFKAVTSTGKILCVHADDQGILDERKRMYENESRPYVHYLARPSEAEIEAIRYALQLSREHNTRLHIVHVSTEGGLDLIRNAKQEGLDITCETCPHYLLMTRYDLARLGPYAKMNPPLRKREDQEALWEGINDGTIDFITTDHAPHTIEEKEKGFENIWKAPSGVPGVENSLMLMLNAVNQGRLSLERLVELMHGNSVERFGIGDGTGKAYGYIYEGNLANLTVVDLNAPWEIKNSKQMTRCGWSPYDGLEGTGKPVLTVIEGEMYGV